jgi:hypothetical protein
VTITVSPTQGQTENGQSNSFPGGYLTQLTSASNGTISYTFDLKGGATIWADYPSGTVYAQFGGNGHAHVFGDDTWSVTSISGGISSTLSGRF